MCAWKMCEGLLKGIYTKPQVALSLINTDTLICINPPYMGKLEKNRKIMKTFMSGKVVGSK